MPMLDKVKTTNPQAYDEIVRHQKLMPYQPLDIDGLITAVGGVSSLSAVLGKSVSGCIVKVADDDFRIVVNSEEDETRQRFTAAHELAHFLLHKDLIGDKFPENILLRGAGMTNKQETEANKLAAEILMPYRAIDEHITNNDGSFSIRSIAKAFNVSPATMSIRLGIPLD